MCVDTVQHFQCSLHPSDELTHRETFDSNLLGCGFSSTQIN